MTEEDELIYKRYSDKLMDIAYTSKNRLKNATFKLYEDRRALRYFIANNNMNGYTPKEYKPFNIMELL